MLRYNEHVSISAAEAGILHGCICTVHVDRISFLSLWTAAINSKPLSIGVVKDKLQAGITPSINNCQQAVADSSHLPAPHMVCRPETKSVRSFGNGIGCHRSWLHSTSSFPNCVPKRSGSMRPEGLKGELVTDGCIL